MADDSAARYVLLNQLADEFAARFRRGEAPSIEDYCDQRPELAEDIRELFPTLMDMEGAKADARAVEAESVSPAPVIEQLGDFKILREIGHGGMGIVYEAEQVSLGRHVALKLLTQRWVRDRNQLRRFEREAKSAARLHHTNIVPVFGSGEHNGTAYYVMQFIQGTGLDMVVQEVARIEGGGPAAAPEKPGREVGESAAAVARSLVTGEFAAALGDGVDTGSASPVRLETAGKRPHQSGLVTTADTPGAWLLDTHPGMSSGRKVRPLTYWQQVSRIGVQVADALEYAHRQGIIHRDVKPSNILLDLAGTAWVTDFGLAKAGEADKLTGTGDILGTLRYMPPEAFEQKADARSDIYSLALTLYEMLALRPAFDEPDHHKLIKQVSTAEPPRLRKVRAGVPRDLETIIHRAIEREPARRYQSAGELGADLQRFIDDEPIMARRQSAAEAAWRWMRQHKSLAALLTTIGLVLLGTAIASLVLAAHFRQQEGFQRDLAGKEELARRLADRRGEDLYRHLYFAEINLAGQAVNTTGGLNRADELLAKWRDTKPDLRDWEWYYLDRLCQTESRTLRGQFGSARAFAWAPDGSRLAFASGGEPVRIVVPSSGETVGTLPGNAGRVTDLTWSPDGKRLATGCADGTIRIWAVEEGTLLQSLSGRDEDIRTLAWGPDGQRLAAGYYDGAILVWNPDDGKLLLTNLGSKKQIYSLAWRPDSQRIASAAKEESIRIWDPATGKEFPLAAPRTGVRGLAWSPDGKRLASAGNDTHIQIYDTETDKVLFTLRGHEAGSNCVSWSPLGDKLASGSRHDWTVRVWDAVRGKQERVFRGHGGPVHSVSWGPGGAQIASSSSDGTIKIWDASGPKQGVVMHHTGTLVNRAVWSPKGDRLATVGSGKTVMIWDPDTGQAIATLSGHTGGIWCAAWSPDGARLATVSEDVDAHQAIIWDGATGKRLRTLEAGGRGVAWSPDGKRLACAWKDQKVKIWDVDTGAEVLALPDQPRGVSSVAWSPDGALIATASRSSQIKIWDAATGAQQRALHGHSQSYVRHVAWSGDGSRFASCGDDGTIHIWDLSTGSAEFILRGHTSAVYQVDWSPNGKRLASASLDRSVKIWHADNGMELLTIDAKMNWVNTVAWSPDGMRLACSGFTGAIRIYDGRPAAAASPERTARELLLLARAHQRLGELASAEKELDEAMALLGNESDPLVLELALDLIAPRMAQDPKNPLWSLLKFRCNARRGHDVEALADLERAFQLDRALVLKAEDFGALFAAADAAAVRANWPLVAAAYTHIPDAGLQDSLDFLRAACIHAFLGNKEKYRRSCEAMLNRFEKTNDANEAERTAKACLLLPGLIQETTKVRRLATLASDQGPTNAYYRLTRALAEYRAGRFTAALEWCASNLKGAPPAEVRAATRLLLPMADYRQGNERARKMLAQALAAAPNLAGPPLDKRNWHDWLFVAVLRREAEALLSAAPAPKPREAK
jgi:eukaryotic-like serine/threonine-protein kinase